MKSPSVIVIALALTCSIQAQPRNLPQPSGNSDPAKAARDVADQRVVVSRAKSLGSAGNVTAAEAELTALNRAKPNTAWWHLETAQRLLSIGDQLSRENRLPQVRAFATRAMQHLEQVPTKTTDSRLLASAKMMAGHLYERYLGDRAAALAAYESASTLRPGDARANESVSRMRVGVSRERSVVSPAGKN